MPTINKPKKKREYIDYNKKREKRQSVYNTGRWRDMRIAKLQNNPLCEICEIEGRITLAEEVHHALSFVDVPENQMLAVAYDYDNLISVCKKCHSRCHTGDLQGTQSLDEIRHKITQKTKDK